MPVKLISRNIYNANIGEGMPVQTAIFGEAFPSPELKAYFSLLRHHYFLDLDNMKVSLGYGDTFPARDIALADVFELNVWMRLVSELYHERYGDAG